MEAKAGVPTNFVHWLHQTYTMRWKGALDISTVPGPEHAHKNPQWCCTLTATGAVVRDKEGKNTNLEPLQGQGQGKSKKQAEQQAARQVYDALVAAGWYDPEGPPPAKKSGGVVGGVPGILSTRQTWWLGRCGTYPRFLSSCMTCCAVLCACSLGLAVQLSCRADLHIRCMLIDIDML
jgi:hypothetical protein